ncbi:Integrase core domain-containing protein [Caldanaerovirga acetigignens]|uniref:Integrase core domain-containing protein n=1 Tax=Caldanaerovirga acetigignens TaxID=447595 RepID=A0A1M7MS31_9FIRM|nr:Integrase core domain-containing protein [Caldanaerovirga acetigignens]
MVLGYFRAIYVEFTNRCDVHTFIRCLIHGFEYFNGITDVVLTDRMKTVILGTDENRKPIWNSTFEDLAATLGFTPKVCRARRPQTKGKVESSIDFVKNNFLPGRKFVDYGDLNHQAIVWCEKKNRRIHGTTGPQTPAFFGQISKIPGRSKESPQRRPFELRRRKIWCSMAV